MADKNATGHKPVPWDAVKIFPPLLLFFLFTAYADYVFWIKKLLLSQPFYSYLLLTPFISALLFLDAGINNEKKADSIIGSLSFAAYFFAGFFVFLTGSCLGVRFLQALALPFFIHSLCIHRCGSEAARKYIFPAAFLIFLYPFEWRFSFLAPWINAGTAHAAKTFFSLFGYPAALSADGMTVTLGTFKLMLVERCAGLHVITLFVMFLCICPWKYRFGSRQAVLWIASIPAVILYLNFARILALGWAGAEARRWMSIEAAHFTGSFLYLAGLALCFRLLFLSLKPETDGHKPG